MTIKEYVNDILCVPMTRIGNRFITEAIEFVLDTQDHKFYSRIASIHKVTSRYLEKAMRDAKTLGCRYMDPNLKNEIFGKETIPTSEYVLKAAEYYRRTYENKEA